MKEMLCIPTCYTDESIEVRALNVIMPNCLPVLDVGLRHPSAPGDVIAQLVGLTLHFLEAALDQVPDADDPAQRSTLLHRDMATPVLGH